MTTLPPVALIAGISGGMGLKLAERLTASGWRLAGYSRNAERLEAVRKLNPDALLWQADTTEATTADNAVTKTLDAFGQLNAYVHLPGSIMLKSAHMIRDAEWDDCIALNLTSAFRGLRAAIRPMQKGGGGSIVLMSTAAAQTGIPNHEAIAAAKSGIDGLTRSAAASYANKNIRVNAVAPGLVDTPLAAPVVGNESARRISESMHPLGRIGHPDEIAALIAFLLSADATWITGQVYNADGGLAHLRTRPKG